MRGVSCNCQTCASVAREVLCCRSLSVDVWWLCLAMRSDGGMMMALQSLLKRASSLEKLSLCSSFGLHNVRSAITEVSLEPDLQDSRSMNVLVTFSVLAGAARGDQLGHSHGDQIRLEQRPNVNGSRADGPVLPRARVAQNFASPQALSGQTTRDAEVGLSHPDHRLTSTTEKQKPLTRLLRLRISMCPGSASCTSWNAIDASATATSAMARWAL